MKNSIRKKMIIPAIYFISFLLVSLCVIIIGKGVNYYLEQTDKTKYVEKEVLDNSQPVVKEEISTIIKPYEDKNVTIGKYFYDYKSDAEKQEKSIVYYENTYMQNSGVDYISEKEFNILNILDGEVITIKEDKNLGKIVEIKHDKDIITVYQGLDKVLVKKGDKIKQSDVIGTSGTSKINPDYKSYLHFEVYYKGKLIDPEGFYSLNINDL